ncbi:hypothetical protein SLS63_003485 [Diaporthe eres]|uniref:C2H2-type domain-containing protein n=1 Tax=Diaporthe eres TaxID=83184 RepID=A0ABR1PGI1_DIAER
MRNFWSSTTAVANPDQIWYDLCEKGKRQMDAIRLCQKFLSIYATRRKRYRVDLGPSEKKAERTVKSARTLANVWRSLVVHFNRTVLAQKRREDPANSARWNLSFKEGLFSQKGVGPVYELIRWIGAESDKMGLSRNQMFVKKEATAEDIALILQTLWQRAEDIPCTPITRISFHAMLLLAAIGGFRPGVVENVKYKQVSIRVLRHPKTHEKRLVATFTLQQNKLRPNAIKTDQKDVIEFSVTFVPYRLFCPASLVVAQGLSEDAFDPSFGSAEELLKRPLMEKGIKSVTLGWKEKLLEKEIFPISYRDFWEIWSRVLLVAGFPESLRPYAVRVGAGSRMNGALTPALRNYILSHSNTMFERSYQPRHMKEDLVSILAPEAKAEDADDLFQILRNSSLRCDQLAPFDVHPEDIENWKSTREDMRALLSSNDYRKSTQIRVLTQKLSRARVAEQRGQYFKETNRRRALGQDTGDLQTPRPRLRARRGAEFPAEAISEYLKQDRTDDCNKLEFIYIDMLVAYLEQRSQSVPTCFICAGASTLEATGKTGDGIFKSWKDVWKHTNRAHRRERLWPFSCPECDRLGHGETLDQIADLGEWCSHVHEHHAPGGLAPYRCILGCQTFENTTALREHLVKCHRALWTVAEPFPCPECCRMGSEDCIISDRAEWRRHIDLHHDPKLLPSTTEASSANPTEHRCLLCSDQCYPTKTGLSLHNTNIHVKGEDFTSPFPCPECHRLGQVERIISGLDEWSPWGIQKVADKTPYTRCLICNGHFKGISGHFTKAHVAKGVFSQAFSCPECARTKTDQSKPPLIQGPEEWRTHCAVVHQDVSGSVLAHSMNLSRKQAEMDRLAKNRAQTTEHASEAEEERQGKSDASQPPPRRIKRPREDDEPEMGARRRREF